MGCLSLRDIDMNEKRSDCLDIMGDSIALSHRDCCFPFNQPVKWYPEEFLAAHTA